MEWLEEVNKVLNEWYVMFPVILTFITSILLPTLVRIHQAHKQTKKLIELANNTIDNNTDTMRSANEIYEILIDFLEKEIEFNNEQLKVEVNKRKKMVLGEKISQYENLLVKANGKKKNFGIPPISIGTQVKKRKVRVKKTKKTESAE